MHYGDGMMKEEIQRARRRAEAASPRRSGYEYTSPLGAGFSFDSGRPMREQMNPYSRRGKRQHDHIVNGGIEIEYEEAYIDMGAGGGLSSPGGRGTGTGGKESVVERMKARRRERVRERGDENPYKRPTAARGDAGGGSEAWSGTACSIM